MYSSQVNSIIAEFESAPVNEISTMVEASGKIAMLTQSMMDILKLLEDTIDEMDSLASQEKIYLDHAFNMAKFKIDGAITAPFGAYIGRI